jgi:uncharacterized protein (TIGR02147 family)
MKSPTAHTRTKSPRAPNLEETSFRHFLQGELIRRCEKNAAYSLRAFARTLGCDVSTLSKILKGKRPTGRITIEKLGARLGLSPERVQRFMESRERPTTATANTSTMAGPDYQQLTLDSFKIISDWYHYGILELMRVDHFKPDSKWIARTLGLTVSEVNIAVERLVRVGILEINAQGEWIDHSEGRSTTIGNEFSAAAFRNLQRQVLELALKALEEVPMDKRDQTSMTMAIDSRLLPEAKTRIKNFRRELAHFLSRGEKRDAVYNLGISLYPLTREKGK